MLTETEEKIYAEPWKEVGLALFLTITYSGFERKESQKLQDLGNAGNATVAVHRLNYRLSSRGHRIHGSLETLLASQIDCHCSSISMS